MLHTHITTTRIAFQRTIKGYHSLICTTIIKDYYFIAQTFNGLYLAINSIDKTRCIIIKDRY